MGTQAELNILLQQLSGAWCWCLTASPSLLINTVCCLARAFFSAYFFSVCFPILLFSACSSCTIQTESRGREARPCKGPAQRHPQSCNPDTTPPAAGSQRGSSEPCLAACSKQLKPHTEHGEQSQTQQKQQLCPPRSPQGAGGTALSPTSALNATKGSLRTFSKHTAGAKRSLIPSTALGEACLGKFL